MDSTLSRELETASYLSAYEKVTGQPLGDGRALYGYKLEVRGLSVLLQDIRYAFRQLRKSPGFTITAVLTLALGIGANTAIFTLVYAVLLKSLPVANPQQLYRIGDNDNCCVYGSLQEKGWGVFSYDLYQYLRDHTPEFEQMAAMSANVYQISVRRSGSKAPAEPFTGEFVSGNYFATFGLQPRTGRLLTPQDDRAAAPPALVISYRAWQRHFGLDPAIVGSTVTVNGSPYTVAGVTPPAFYGDRLRADPPDFFLPIAFEPSLQQDSSLLHIPYSHWLYLIGRMKPGVAAGPVESRLTSELRQWLPIEAAHLPPDDREKIPKQFLKLGPGGAGVANLQTAFQPGLYLLIASSALVLLIACANLANLLLARGTARRQQTALQLALGSTRSRLIRALLTESILLAFIGGLAGICLAYFGSRGILLILFRGATFIPIDTNPSAVILAFAFLLSLVTGMVFGVAPAWISSHSDPAETLRGANRSTRDKSALPQKSLIVAQASISLVLLAMAGLVTQSLRNLEHFNFGFDPTGRMIVQIDPLSAGYTQDRLPWLYQQFRDRLGQIPGVVSVSYSMYSPQDGDNWSEDVFIEGRSRESTENIDASWLKVGPDYFKTVGTPLVRGRVIGEQDTPNSQRIAVVDEKFVRTFFPHQDPIGQHFGFARPQSTADYEIVGVVKDTQYRDPSNADQQGQQNPMFFLPFSQWVHFTDPSMQRLEAQSQYALAIELQTTGATGNVGPQVRRTLASIDPNLSIIDMRTFGEQVSRQFNLERLVARLTDLFSLLALLLASIGLYGVTAYNIARRTSEIGIRMALGANRRDVLAMVLRGAFFQIAIGLLIGVPLALATGRIVANRLFRVGAFDPRVLGAAVAVLALCGLLAGWIPARRAASIEPVQALRSE